MIKTFKKMSLSQKASVLAAIVSTLNVGYMQFSTIWGLPYSDEVSATSLVVVSVISTILGFMTGGKLKRK